MKNKLAQIVSLVFLHDYPTVWPTFFSDMMQYSTLNAEAADIYLRILKAIDVEVVDREVAHSIEVHGCTLLYLKDFLCFIWKLQNFL